MTIVHEDRGSDSPLVDVVMQGFMPEAGATIRPAESAWHMVFTRVEGRTHALVSGPWTSAEQLEYGAGAEILWVRFQLGVFMPHMPTRDFRDREQALPEAAGSRFWLHGSAWQPPDFENVEEFIARLVRDGALEVDPVVRARLEEPTESPHPAIPARTVRHRFQHATGLSRKQIEQITRARRAETLLRQGAPILDTVYQLGYYDQPHLTRALKRWIGFTPAQIFSGTR